MKMTVKVNADHAGESLTRRLRTGFLVFLNKAPIYWLSKKQTSCKTSTFGSEFVAMKQTMDICAKWYRGHDFSIQPKPNVNWFEGRACDPMKDVLRAKH